MHARRVTARSRQRGITLVEVLVAVTVLAIALIGTLRALESQTRNTSALAARMFAHWTALNAIEAARLQDVEAGHQSRETTKLGGVVWTVTVRREPASDGLIRLTATSTAAGHPGAVLVGFLPAEDEE